MQITDFHATYYSHLLTRHSAESSIETLAATLQDSKVDLNPHQIEAALFALRSPYSRGIIEADEVGLGKTIVAGIVMDQKWAEDKRRILVIVPANLRRQWQLELEDKFYLPAVIIDGDSFNKLAQTQQNPFFLNEIVITSYNFAHSKAEYLTAINWDICVIDEAHKLRNVYKPDNVIARSIRDALKDSYKMLLTATPLQNSLLELYGLISFIDEYTFGSLESFKAQFSFLRDEKQKEFTDLVDRLKGGSVNPRNKLNNMTDFILWYAKSQNAQIIPAYTLEDEETQAYINERFKYTDENGRRYRLSPIISPTYSGTLVYEYKGYSPPPNGWSLSRERMEQFEAEGRLHFPQKKSQRIQRKQFLDEYKGRPIGNLWADINVINPMSKERMEFVGQKPEALIERVLTLSTNEGDIVLDSFLGSGTTAAVALKMKRRFIGIELGEHAYTHCYPRLKAVVDGEQGGISKVVNWQGGSGFKFYELAPTLLETDERGILEISNKYNEEMLAQAMAKHEGYTYAPDNNIFWKHGYSGVSNFIFTTTGHISPKYLDNIASQLSEGEYLLICAESFDGECVGRHKNIIVSPIPKMLLGRCEWGKDNYDLNIIMRDVTDWGDDDE